MLPCCYLGPVGPSFSFVSKHQHMIPLAFGIALLLNNAIQGPSSQPVFVAEAQTVEEYVRSYFSDAPVMAEIAKCETRFRHFGRNGRVLRGEVTPEDVGVMQVNEYFHGKTADKLGFDIYSIEGNVAYARYLYEKEGTQPWVSSKKCWGKSEHVAKI